MRFLDVVMPPIITYMPLILILILVVLIISIIVSIIVIKRRGKK